MRVSSRSGADGIWIADGGAARELWRAEGGKLVGAPEVSSDGTRIAFCFRKGGRRSLNVINGDGTGLRSLAPKLDAGDTPAWSPDGRSIAVSESNGRIYLVPVDGQEPKPLTNELSRGPIWSPDGKMVVYYQTLFGASYRIKAINPETGKAWPLPEIFVRGERDHFRFAANNRQLVILQGEFRRQDFWLLDLDSGKLRRLTDLKPCYRVDSFDVSRDGKRILFDRSIENSDVVLIDLPPSAR